MAAKTPGTRDVGHYGVWAACAGCACQLVGLAWDGLLHRRDASLAERESVCCITNPGHLLGRVGWTVALLGVSCAMYHTGEARMRTRAVRRGPALSARGVEVLGS